MKITKQQLKQIIKEELEKIKEVGDQLPISMLGSDDEPHEDPEAGFNEQVKERLRLLRDLDEDFDGGGFPVTQEERDALREAYEVIFKQLQYELSP